MSGIRKNNSSTSGKNSTLIKHGATIRLGMVAPRNRLALLGMHLRFKMGGRASGKSLWSTGTLEHVFDFFLKHQIFFKNTSI
jgi:hypothetical protein